MKMDDLGVSPISGNLHVGYIILYNTIKYWKSKLGNLCFFF